MTTTIQHAERLALWKTIYRIEWSRATADLDPTDRDATATEETCRALGIPNTEAAKQAWLTE